MTLWKVCSDLFVFAVAWLPVESFVECLVVCDVRNERVKSVKVAKEGLLEAKHRLNLRSVFCSEIRFDWSVGISTGRLHTTFNRKLKV